jgi:hypothetical protein
MVEGKEYIQNLGGKNLLENGHMEDGENDRKTTS